MPGSAGASANSELRMSPITNACSGASPAARATVDTVNERPSACTRSSLLKVKRLKVRHRGNDEDARPSRHEPGDKSHERRKTRFNPAHFADPQSKASSEEPHP